MKTISPEKIAYWFFRLNGCLTIVNFIVHPDLIQQDELRSQRTDVDILAVRFPYRCELFTSGQPMQDHGVFDSRGLIDLVIAEVKHGPCRLNGPWTRLPDQNIHRVLYAVGAFDKAHVPAVAESLYRHGYYSNEQLRVRLFAIGRQKSGQLPPSVVQLTWEEVLRFVYHRLSTYREHKSQHDQWDSVGRCLYSLSTKVSADKFVSMIESSMDRFIRSRERRA